MTGYTQNTRGRYKCNFCNHPAYKRQFDVVTHLQGKHELEITKAILEENKAEVTRLRSQPPKVVEKERIVYRDAPQPEKVEYWYPKAAGIFCTTCKVVMCNAGIPIGQTVESTPHHCGNRTLMLVMEIQ